MDNDRLVKQVGKLVTALRVLLDDLNADARLEESLRQVERDLAAAENNDVAASADVDVSLLEELRGDLGL